MRGRTAGSSGFFFMVNIRGTAFKSSVVRPFGASALLLRWLEIMSAPRRSVE
jgi:hypothetical protein